MTDDDLFDVLVNSDTPQILNKTFIFYRKHHVSNSNVSIEKCEFKYYGDSGIHLEEGCKNVIISNCIFYSVERNHKWNIEHG